MRNGLLVGSGALVVLGLIVWLVWSVASGAGGETDDVALPTEEADSAEPGPTEPGQAPTLDAVESGDRSVDAATQRQKLDVEPAEGKAAIQVIFLGPDDERVAHAEALLIENIANDDTEAWEDLDRVDAWFREHGTPHQADQNGELWIPAPNDGYSLVVAHTEELWGRGWIDWGTEGPVEVELTRDVILRARVVDGSGAPVLKARVRFEPRHTDMEYGRRVRPVEGPEAIASFPHAQHTTDGDPGATWVLVPDGLLDPPVEHALDADALPTEVVTLVVPSAGSVVVEILDELGSPFTGSGKVKLELIREGEARVVSYYEREFRPWVILPIQDGRARFADIAVGCELVVEVLRWGSLIPTRAITPGPHRLGETTVLQVRLGSDHPVVQLRAVDEDARPIANERLRLSFVQPDNHTGTYPGAAVTTDKEGVFRVDLDPDWPAGMSHILGIFRGARRAPDAMAEVEVGHDLVSGLLDKGTVTLTRPPVFVAGQVVSPDGAPIPDVPFNLSAWSADDPRWEGIGVGLAMTDVAGRFEVRGIFEGERFRLSTLSSEWFGSPVEFRRGEPNVVLVLQAAGAIKGTILFREDVNLQRVFVHATSEDDSEAGRGRHSFPLRLGSTFLLQGLPPGEYTLAIEDDESNEDLFEVSAIHVRGGETTCDPRLDPLDLRERAWNHRLVLHSAEGKESLEGEVFFSPAGEGPFRKSWFYHSPVDLLTTSEAVDIVVVVPGYRPERREGIYDEVEIKLRLGIPVRLVLRGDALLPAPPTFLKACLVPAEEEYPDLDFQTPAFGESQEILFRIPRPGRMRVAWIVERRRSRGVECSLAKLPRQQFIEVLDAETEQAFDVTLSEEELRSLVGVAD